MSGFQGHNGPPRPPYGGGLGEMPPDWGWVQSGSRTPPSAIPGGLVKGPPCPPPPQWANPLRKELDDAFKASQLRQNQYLLQPQYHGERFSIVRHVILSPSSALDADARAGATRIQEAEGYLGGAGLGSFPLIPPIVEFASVTTPVEVFGFVVPFGYTVEVQRFGVLVDSWIGAQRAVLATVSVSGRVFAGPEQFGAFTGTDASSMSPFSFVACGDSKIGFGAQVFDPHSCYYCVFRAEGYMVPDIDNGSARAGASSTPIRSAC